MRGAKLTAISISETSVESSHSWGYLSFVRIPRCLLQSLDVEGSFVGPKAIQNQNDWDNLGLDAYMSCIIFEFKDDVYFRC